MFDIQNGGLIDLEGLKVPCHNWVVFTLLSHRKLFEDHSQVVLIPCTAGDKSFDIVLPENRRPNSLLFNYGKTLPADSNSNAREIISQTTFKASSSSFGKLGGLYLLNVRGEMGATTFTDLRFLRDPSERCGLAAHNFDTVVDSPPRNLEETSSEFGIAALAVLQSVSSSDSRTFVSAGFYSDATRSAFVLSKLEIGMESPHSFESLVIPCHRFIVVKLSQGMGHFDNEGYTHS
mmetsp:Transcript_21540/g.33188  ORF Transcript_21540/g.33188 Transcript_21540/m.33188 type:complete len:234 (+) Transcript_21540:145-846(+)